MYSKIRLIIKLIYYFSLFSFLIICLTLVIIGKNRSLSDGEYTLSVIGFAYLFINGLVIIMSLLLAYLEHIGLVGLWAKRIIKLFIE